MALGLIQAGSHWISRLRKTCVAFEPIPPTEGKRKRGRPRLYGRKIHLFTLFEKADDRWTTAASPVYGEKDVRIRYLCLDLLWRPIRRLPRFVLVQHPDDCSRPGLVQLRLLALHHPTRNSPIRTGRDDRSP